MRALSLIIVLVLCLLSPPDARAQTSPSDARSQTLGLVFSVQDLVFTVEDMGGEVQDLAVRETDTELRIELASDVLFGFDSAELQPKAQAALAQVAAVIRERATGQVRIEGHTDAKGSDAYNRKLSQLRARAVLDWLLNKEGLKGLKGVKFASMGLGETKPVAPNAKPDGSDDPEGRQKNRRVEIVVVKKG